MSRQLSISAAQFTEQGKKPENQDFHGIVIPDDLLLTTKGIVAAIADGMSGSSCGREASEACVNGFLNDYLSTPDSWTVKKSAQAVLSALNSWLFSKGQSFQSNQYGLVTTLSAMILKSNTAHLFHVGDSRIYRYRGNDLVQLTRDHRVWVSPEKNYLNRAMGIDYHLDIDYRTTLLEVGDVYLFTTDGIHDYLEDCQIAKILENNASDLEAAVKQLAHQALTAESPDNVSCQILRIDHLPEQEVNEALQKLTSLPFPPDLAPGQKMDGYEIIKEIHASKRSQCYLAINLENQQKVVIKTPSINFEDDPEYLDSFHHEEWIGKRLDSPYVIRVLEHSRKRQFLYHILEYVDGQTLRQWMDDHPTPDFIQIRAILEQIANGLRAFHRLEMIHQDLKPENIMINRQDQVKIIDFGSTKIAGLEEISSPFDRSCPMGTENYIAPEYLLGYAGSHRSDQYSLAVIAYEMFTQQLPFKLPLIQKSSKHREYIPAYTHNASIPIWIDGALRRALQHDPNKRYEEMSEFIYDLSHPNKNLISAEFKPLLDKNPTEFWRWLALALLALNVYLLTLLLK